MWFLKVRRIVASLFKNNLCIDNVKANSADYELINPRIAATRHLNGWNDIAVARRQDAAYRSLIKQMYGGTPRQDFLIAAEAVRHTGIENPLILEVGCGTGYYSEILSYLLGYQVRYVGLDYSQAMIRSALEIYNDYPFVTGDASLLPFASKTFDIVLNGVSLMHILDYQKAIAESHRVTRRYCIFHTVPVLQRKETTFLYKNAYGGQTIEVILNEEELYHLLKQNGLVVQNCMESVPYNLESVLGEHTVTKTYLCKVEEYWEG